MKTLIILSFGLLLANLSWSQESALKIKNTTFQKEVIIKENKRIKIQMENVNKISGRFKLNINTLLIGREHVDIFEIQTLKRNPLLISILGRGALTHAGVIIAGFAVIIGALVDLSALLLAIPATVMIYVGIKSPHLSRNYKSLKDWNFEIIARSEITIGQ